MGRGREGPRRGGEQEIHSNVRGREEKGRGGEGGQGRRRGGAGTMAYKVECMYM